MNWRGSGEREGTPWLSPLAATPEIGRAGAGKILIGGSDCVQVLPV